VSISCHGTGQLSGVPSGRSPQPREGKNQAAYPTYMFSIRNSHFIASQMSPHFAYGALVGVGAIGTRGMHPLALPAGPPACGTD
jgi:hypothetical protein